MLFHINHQLLYTNPLCWLPLLLLLLLPMMVPIRFVTDPVDIVVLLLPTVIFSPMTVTMAPNNHCPFLSHDLYKLWNMWIGPSFNITMMVDKRGSTIRPLSATIKREKKKEKNEQIEWNKNEQMCSMVMWAVSIHFSGSSLFVHFAIYGQWIAPKNSIELIIFDYKHWTQS